MKHHLLSQTTTSAAETADIDDTPLQFGKYKSKTPNEVADIEPSYIVWMHANVLPPLCTRGLAQACEDSGEDDTDNWLSYDNFRD